MVGERGDGGKGKEPKEVSLHVACLLKSFGDEQCEEREGDASHHAPQKVGRKEKQAHVIDEHRDAGDKLESVCRKRDFFHARGVVYFELRNSCLVIPATEQ